MLCAMSYVGLRADAAALFHGSVGLRSAVAEWREKAPYAVSKARSLHCKTLLFESKGFALRISEGSAEPFESEGLEPTVRPHRRHSKGLYPLIRRVPLALRQTL